MCYKDASERAAALCPRGRRGVLLAKTTSKERICTTIEIPSQMLEFVNFAQDAAANNAKNTIARLGKRDSIFFAFPVGGAAAELNCGESVLHLSPSGYIEP